MASRTIFSNHVTQTINCSDAYADDKIGTTVYYPINESGLYLVIVRLQAKTASLCTKGWRTIVAGFEYLSPIPTVNYQFETYSAIANLTTVIGVNVAIAPESINGMNLHLVRLG